MSGLGYLGMNLQKQARMRPLCLGSNDHFMDVCVISETNFNSKLLKKVDFNAKIRHGMVTPPPSPNKIGLSMSNLISDLDDAAFLFSFMKTAS